MDQAILVENQIDGGQRLVLELSHQNFDVTAACWIKTGDDAQWFLHIASNEVDTAGLVAAYQVIYLTIQSMHGSGIDPFDVKLIAAQHPIAKDVMELQRRYPATSPTRFRGVRLGGVYVDEAYVYPPVGP